MEETMTDLEAPYETVRSEPRALVSRSPVPHAASLRELWLDLMQGRSQIMGAYGGQGWLELRVGTLAIPAPALGARTRYVVERLLQGQSQKVCAQELQVSTSSVASLAKHGLNCIGFHSLPSRVPLPVVLLACSAYSHGAFPSVVVSEFNERGARGVTLSVATIDLFPGLLSRAERAVVALIVEGLSCGEIAERRGTSIRTVANQVTATFHRLRISGRSELLACVAHSLAAPRGVAAFPQ
jgi:DNA-binding NarL/FixJ family response regulator